MGDLKHNFFCCASPHDADHAGIRQPAGVTGSILEGKDMSCPEVSLAPAESMICNASYAITSGDIDSYQVGPE